MKNSADIEKSRKLKFGKPSGLLAMKFAVWFSLILFFFFILDGSEVWAQSGAGQVTVKKWKDNKKAAFSFTFDDGLMTQYTNAWPILNQYGFKATFYVIPPSLTDGSPQIWRYGYWSQFQALAAAGNEIGDHTMTHPNLTTMQVGDTSTAGTISYEMYQAKKIIEEKIPGQKCISFAYPYFANNTTTDNVASLYFESARGGGGGSNSAGVTGGAWYDLVSSDIKFDQPRKTLSDDQDELISYEDTLASITIADGTWKIFLAHDVLPFSDISSGAADGIYYPVSNEWLSSLCQFVKAKSDSNKLWVATVGDVTRYIKERENFSSSIIAQSNDQIEINPTDNLDDSIFNYPLTVDITVPAGWTDVVVTQGTSSVHLTTSNNGTNTYVRTNIIPDGGNVILQNNSSTQLYTVGGQVTYDNNSQTPLSNVTVQLTSVNDTLTAVTDAGGNYSFTGIAAGSYKIAAIKSGNGGGVNSTDALLAARYFANLIQLDSLQVKAADVNGSGSVNGTDALIIARRFVGLSNSFPSGEWVFSDPGTINVSSDATVNIKGLAAGDINGSFKPAN